MKPKPKVLIVEDKLEDQREVTNYLADEDFCGPEDIVGFAATVDEAKQVLEARSSEIDLVLLDLNLPASSGDSTPEKLSGKRVLDIVQSLNGKAGVSIKVIIVSGEDMMEVQAQREMFERTYEGTLIAITQKADLASTIQLNLKKFYRDPLRNLIQKSGLDVLAQYDKIVDPECEIQAKLDDACALAIRLLRNELDHAYKRPGASDDLADNLNGLIWKLSQDRFQANDKGKHFIAEAKITSPGGWEAFLWRGTMEHHFQTLLRYRNEYAHMRAKPFRAAGKNHWQIDEDSLKSIESGKVLSQVVELIVKEILEWYLPWHEQVYKPWREKIGK